MSAARNSRIVAWMTSTISTGMPARTCINPAPARSAPNSSAAAAMPNGCDRPSSATAIASKPIDVPYDGIMKWLTPRISVAPAIPKRSPDRLIVNMIRNLGRMPA